MPRRHGPRRRPGEDLTQRDLIHRLERSEDDDVERKDDEAGAHHEKRPHRDRRPSEPPPSAAQRNWIGEPTSARPTHVARHAFLAVCRFSCQVVVSTIGRKMTAVMPSMTTAAADA